MACRSPRPRFSVAEAAPPGPVCGWLFTFAWLPLAATGCSCAIFARLAVLRYVTWGRYTKTSFFFVGLKHGHVRTRCLVPGAGIREFIDSGFRVLGCSGYFVQIAILRIPAFCGRRWTSLLLLELYAGLCVWRRGLAAAAVVWCRGWLRSVLRLVDFIFCR